MDPLPLVRTVAGHEPVRGIVLGLLCVSVLAAFALPEPRRWPSPLTVGALGLLVGVLRGRTGAFALSYLIPLAAASAPCSRCGQAAALVSLALLVVLAGDLAWQATHQDQPLRWLRESQIAPAPSGSAAFLLARQRAEGPFRIATAAPEPTLVHQLGAHRSKRARALLLDQEALRLGLEDVAGYNPVHLKRYDRLMLASNGGRKVDRHFELALRYATPQLRSLAVRYYVSPPGKSPPGLPVVYRDRLSVVTRDDAALPFARIVRPGRAPQAARVVAREPDRIVIARPGPGASSWPTSCTRAGASRSTGGRCLRWRRRPARRRGAGRARGGSSGRSRRPAPAWVCGSRSSHSPSCSASRCARACCRSGPGAAAAVPIRPGSPSIEGVRICRNLPMHAPWPSHSPPSSTTTPSTRTPPLPRWHASPSAPATRWSARSRRSPSAWDSCCSAIRRSRCPRARPACRVLRRGGRAGGARRARRAPRRPALRVPDPRGRACGRSYGEHRPPPRARRALSRLVLVAEGVEPASGGVDGIAARILPHADDLLGLAFLIACDGVKVHPASIALLDRLLGSTMRSPLYSPAIPEAHVRIAIQRLRASIDA